MQFDNKSHSQAKNGMFLWRLVGTFGARMMNHCRTRFIFIQVIPVGMIRALFPLMLAVAVGGSSPAHASQNNPVTPTDGTAMPAAEAVPQAAQTFIANTCARCHNSEKKSG